MKELPDNKKKIKSSNTTMLPWLAAAAFFMQSLDSTILNTSIPTIAADLDCTPISMKYTIVSYALTIAILIPASGWLSDRFGTRKLFISSVFFFTVGSLFCAMSNTLSLLVISRVVQAIGGALMMPVCRLAILRTYPRNELLGVINLISIPGLIGPVLGPLLGGFITTYSSWHFIFLINIPIGIILIVFSIKAMPNFTMPKQRFDQLGFILFSFFFIFITIGIDTIGEQIIPVHYSLLLVAVSFIFIIGYAFHARFKKNPLIRLSLFKSRIFTIGIAGGLATRLGINSVPFLMPLLLQTAFGYSAIQTGFMMLPLALGSLFSKIFVTHIITFWGYKRTLMFGTLLMGSIIMSFSFPSEHSPIAILIVLLFIMGILMSVQFTSMNTLTLGVLNEDNVSEGNSLMSTIQQLSISMSIGLSAAVYSLYEYLHVGSNNEDYIHYTFITMGAITLLSAFIFFYMKPTDGNILINKKK